MHAPQDFTRMLDLIVCPACRGPLAATDHGAAFSCKTCARRYSIKDGIPVLIPTRENS